MTDIFVANALLGSTSVSIPHAEPTHGVLNEFVANGLLGDSSGFSKMEVDANPESAPEISDIVSEPSLFTANGLLGEFNASASNASEIPPESQDDFPDFSKILGLPLTPSLLPIDDCRSSVRATTYDGRAFHIKRRPRALPTSNLPPKFDISNLLDVPIHRLMDELSRATAAQLTTPNMNVGSTSASVKAGSFKEETLWVDQYRPDRFTDLLGNERVAREAMAWVKQWDWCVFGKRRAGKKRLRDNDENFNADDEYHRPREKLLLLSGPPGLGKTTLAHVVARQAGYDVMEINASDSRSAQVIEDRIQPALESGSAIGSTRPVLVVIDEIDGATGGGDNTAGFIQKLIQLTYDQPKKKRRSNKNIGEKRPLLRPIICICNDQNAHSLVKLRSHARQIRFTRPADNHLIKRLREICEAEGLKADSRALSTLVAVAKGDLRACLNALQFIKSKGEDVTEPLIRRATVGIKEVDTSAISVINDLFAPMSRKRVKELGMGEEEEARYVNRLSRDIEAINNPSSIATNCFAHYMNCHRYDAHFSRYDKGIEWLVNFDVFSSIMYNDNDFGLHTYLPYFLVPFHSLFRERGSQRVEKDQVDWDNYNQTRANEEIYKALSQGIRTGSSRNAGNYRHLITGHVFQLEFMPLINRIISPPLRPVNSQIVKPAERALLSRLVEIMVALELRFVQERAEDGQLSYRLDPPIDVFVTYEGKRASDLSVSRFAVRHLVATEIDAALVARHAQAVEKTNDRKIHPFTKLSEPLEEAPEEEHGAKDAIAEGLSRTDSSENAPPSKRARIEKEDIADKPPVDFFGRLITVSSSISKPGTRKKTQQGFRVMYRFLEGNSAAVRKPIKVAAFL